MRRLSPIGGFLTMALLWTACNKDVNEPHPPPEPPPPSQATVLAKVSGDDQSAVTGTALSQPFVVRITDAPGDPVAGVKVSWAVTEGGGSLSGTSETTNDQGESSMILTLGAASGTNVVTASVAGLAGSPATFTATGITPQATVLETVSGDNQVAAAGSELALPFVVRTTDASGDPVADVEIAWAVTAGGGSLSATSGTTSAEGESSVVLTLGAAPGTNRVTASAAGLSGSPATFTATGTGPLPGLSGQIVFASDRDGDSEIYVINADGTGLVRLTDDPNFDSAPVWSPDGTRIAFQSIRTGDGEIFVMNADGSGETNVTKSSGSEDDSPDWSPDGTRIVFGSDRGGNSDIYVMNADGSGVVQLTDDPHRDFGPSWSPDGTSIAFSSNRDSDSVRVRPDIFVMSADGSDQRNLGRTDGLFEFEPAWSPDGTRIAFTGRACPFGQCILFPAGVPDVYVIDADGSNRRRLTEASCPGPLGNHACDRSPAWSPDGAHIAFVTQRDGPEEVYIMGADNGSNPVNLTNDPETDAWPDWRP